MVALLFLGMIAPTAMGVSLGGLRLSVYRVVLIVMFIPMLMALFSGKAGKVNIFDYLAMAHCFWVLLALLNWGGAAGIESAGIYTIEALGAYLVGRLYIRSLEDFEAMSRLFVGIVFVMLCFTLPEAVTGVHILHDGAASVFGGGRAHHIDKRMGLERAFGSFDHPILYGVFSAAAFSLAYFVVAQASIKSLRSALAVFSVVIATFLSASGGPYTVLILQMFVVGWERMTRGFEARWPLLFSIFGLTYVLIDLLSNRTPFHVFVSYFSFSVQSAYNRINIWNYGTAEVARHPIFGIGFNDWIRGPWMSDSMDNFWLLTAMRYGIPSFLFLAALLIGLVYATSGNKKVPQRWRNARHGWSFTLFGIAVASGTVHLWNALFVMFLFLIGSGVWMYNTRPPKSTRPFPGPVRMRPIPTRQTLF